MRSSPSLLALAVALLAVACGERDAYEVPDDPADGPRGTVESLKDRYRSDPVFRKDVDEVLEEHPDLREEARKVAKDPAGTSTRAPDPTAVPVDHKWELDLHDLSPGGLLMLLAAGAMVALLVLILVIRLILGSEVGASMSLHRSRRRYLAECRRSAELRLAKIGPRPLPDAKSSGETGTGPSAPA